jgi:uncharacterized protein (TIGR00255 family)
MTGFGQGSSELPHLRVTVQLRSVNNRFADLRLRLPVEIGGLEAELRGRVLERVRRGRVEMTVQLERPGRGAERPALNVELLDTVLDSAERLQRERHLVGGVDLMGLLSLPGMFRTEAAEPPWGPAEHAALDGALGAALDGFDRDRRREGELLRTELLARIDEMGSHARAARARAAAVPARLEERLHQRLRALSPGIELDPGRVAQEAAILADRADVTEELVRLQGHLDQARSLLADPGGEPVGKRLDFLLQEMLREANTLGSKSGDLELTRSALAIKLAAEKAREQIQNLE